MALRARWLPRLSADGWILIATCAIRTFAYALDHYVCQHEGCGIATGALATAPTNREAAGLAEEFFLHFAEPTRIRLRPPFHPPAWYGAPDPWTIDVDGCDPARGEPVTAACRVQVFAWADTYWVYDLANERFPYMSVRPERKKPRSKCRE